MDICCMRLPVPCSTGTVSLHTHPMHPGWAMSSPHPRDCFTLFCDFLECCACPHVIKCVPLLLLRQHWQSHFCSHLARGFPAWRRHVHACLHPRLCRSPSLCGEQVPDGCGNPSSQMCNLWRVALWHVGPSARLGLCAGEPGTAFPTTLLLPVADG